MRQQLTQLRVWAIALGLLTAISWQHANAQAPTTTNDTICSGGTALLRAAGSALTPDTNYRWFLTASGGSEIPGETNPIYTFQPRFSTTLYVALSNAGVLTARTPVQVIVNTPPKNIFTFTSSSIGLYAYYPFNNSTADVSGNGNNIVSSGLSNGTDRFGAGGNSASNFFANNSGGAVANNPIKTDSLKAFTMLTWLRSNDVDGGLIVGLGNDPNRANLSTQVDRQLYITADGNLRFRLGTNSMVAPANLLNNQWHFVAVTRTADGLVNLYVDGTIRATDSMKVGNNFMGHLRIVFDNLAGAAGNPTNNRLAVTFDDMRIYNRDIAVSELNALYQFPALRVRFANLMACNSVSPIIRVINGQTSVKYTVVDANTNAVVAGPVIGRTDSIAIPTTFFASGSFKISARDTVTGCSTVLDTTLRINVIPNPLPPTALPATQQSCGASTFTLAVSGALQGGYRWFTTPTGGISGYSDSTRTVTVAEGDSIIYYVGQQTPAGCISPRVKVKAITYETIETATGSAFISPIGIFADLPMNSTLVDQSINRRTVTNFATTGTSYVAGRNTIAKQALNFAGQNGLVSIDGQTAGPNNFTASVWFRTSSTTGAKILGFQSPQNGFSGGIYDRQFYITSTGIVHFGVNFGGIRTVKTTRAYNDGNWHHAAGSVSTTDGLAFYIDGMLVGTIANATGGQAFSGFWVMGGGSNTGWPNAPGNNFYTGSVDEVKIYNRTLTGAEIIKLGNSNGTAIEQGNRQICGTASVSSLVLRGTKVGLRYQLRTTPTNVLVGNAVIATTDTVALVTNVIDSTTNYQIVVTNASGTCNVVLDSTLTYYGGTKPTAPNSINQNNCGSGALTLSANGSTNGLYRWFNAATGGFALGVDSTFQTPIVQAGDSLVYYVAKANLVGCESDRIRVVASSTFLPINVANTLSNSLFNRWDFRNGSLLDLAGTNNTASTVGNVTDTTNVSGVSRAAKYFGGTTGDYLTTANRYVAQIRPDYSVTFWIKTNTTTGGHIIGHSQLQTTTSTTQERVIYLDNANRLSFFQRSANGSNPNFGYARSTKAFNDNAWHHVVATSSAAGLKLYVDGNLVGSDASAITTQNNTSWWRMGYNGLNNVQNRPSTDAYMGFLDNVRIYRKALTESEVLALNQDPLLAITATGTNICGSGSSKIRISNAQPNIQYQLLQAGSPVGTAVTAIGDSVVFNTPTLIGNSIFQISATNPTTNCTVTLDTTLRANVFPLPLAATINDTIRCGNGAAIMRAKGATTGNFRWYTAATGGTSVASTNTLSVTITLGTGILLDSAIRYVSISGLGGCEGPRVAVRARAYANNTTAPTVSGTAAGFCTGDSTLLTATGTATSYVWRNGITVLTTNSGTLWVKTTGTYTATGLVAGVCPTATSTPYSITVSAKPALPIITLVGGTIRSIQVPLITGATYTWFFNGGPLTGTTTNSIISPAIGAYRVIINSRGCLSDTSDPFILTSIASYLSGGSISVYPNPNAGQFKVTATDLITNEANLVITDALGRVVLKRQLMVTNGTGTETIEADALSSGVYYVRISANGQSLLHRIVINK